MAARAKKTATKAKRAAKRVKALPSLDVDPTNEAAIAAVAEALVAALLTAAAASARRPTRTAKRPAKTAKKAARTTKRR